MPERSPQSHGNSLFEIKRPMTVAFELRNGLTRNTASVGEGLSRKIKVNPALHHFFEGDLLSHNVRIHHLMLCITTSQDQDNP